jgi:undecaprenyl-diphosphatase
VTGRFWLVLGLLTGLRLLYLWSGIVDLSPDEAYYWEWSRRLDLSYYSKGPFIAYLIHALTTLFGTSAFSIRLGAVIINVLGAWLLYRFGTECFGAERAGFWTMLTLQVIPIFSAGAILMTIDPPFLFFWLVAMVALYRALVKGAAFYWLVAGAALGLGTLAKYTMLFLLLSVPLYLAVAPHARRAFRTRAPYLGLLIAIGMIAPVIVWNARHGWPTFFHVASDGIGPGVDLSNVWQFLLGQVAVLTPPIAACLAWGAWWGWRKGFRDREEPYRFLMAVALPIWLAYLFVSVQTKVQANWPVAAYLPLMLVTVGLILTKWREWGPLAKRWALAFLGFALVLAGAVSVVAHDTSLLDRWGFPLELKLDPTVRVMGWKELGARVGEVAKTMPQPVFLFSSRYQVTSELSFYVEGRPRAYTVNLGRRLSQYDFWEGPERLEGWNAVYVLEGNRAMEPEVKRLCARADPHEVLEVTRGRRVVHTFSLTRCYGFRGIIKSREGKW